MIESRALTAHEAGQMAQLHAAAFDPAEAWGQDAFRGLLSQPATQAQGVFAGEVLIAMIVVQFAAGEGEILTLATDPAQRRKGLARLLVADMTQKLATQGLTRWLLDVAADNRPALEFYRSLGFQVDATRRNYYNRLEGQRVDAMLMSKQVGGQIPR